MGVVEIKNIKTSTLPLVEISELLFSSPLKNKTTRCLFSIKSGRVEIIVRKQGPGN